MNLKCCIKILQIALLARTALAIDGITALPKMSREGHIDQSLWALSEDVNISYRSAHYIGRQLAQQVVSSDKDCFRKFAQRYLPQALFDSNHLGDLDETNVFDETPSLNHGFSEEHRFQLQQGFVSTMIDAFVESTEAKSSGGTNLQSRFLDIVQKSKLPSGVLADAFHEVSETASQPLDVIVAYLESPPSTIGNNSDDVTQYFFIFQLWCIAKRFTLPTSPQKIIEYQTFQEPTPYLASVLIALQESQRCLNIAAKLVMRREVYFLSEETPEKLSSYNILPEISRLENDAAQILQATFVPLTHHSILKKNKAFKKWAKPKTLLLKTYQDAMHYGKELSQESRNIASYHNNIKRIKMKLTQNGGGLRSSHLQK